MPRRPAPEALAAARFMGLDRQPASAEAVSLCELIGAKVATWERERGGRKSSRCKTAGMLRHAVSAIVADLLCGADDGEGWTYRPVAAASFTPAAVSRRLFHAARDALLGLRLVDIVAGFYPGDGKRGRASRFRATPRLIKMARDVGSLRGAFAKHFKHDLPINPIVLRAGSTRVGGERIGGRMMPFPSTAQTLRMAGEVRELDLFIRDVHPVTGGEHRAFIRMFGPGDAPGFRWNMHGRLYSVGGESYQQAPKGERARMRLGGKPVIEIDIGASHLSIYSAKRGHPLDPAVDPYVIPPFSREVIKSWITAAMGHGRFHRRWPSDVAKRIEARSLTLPPIADVQAAVLARHPVMAEWPDDKRTTVHHLMYLESEIILRTLLRLKREHGAPALPVHDSIIVPRDANRIARRVLAGEFKAVVGAAPRLAG